MARTAALVAVYFLLSTATLALIVTALGPTLDPAPTATGPGITLWPTLAYVALPVLVVWLSGGLGTPWAAAPLVAALLVDRLTAADVFGDVDGWYLVPLFAYALLLAVIHLGARTARVVHARARPRDAS